ncbi:MAG: cupredoxin domain-containing protein [Patescibacteria group bacterium]|jgi:plastocyanin domain-containing protein|nr:cupredoxin domain-containing protein [Patescibacteria group bacterium]
MFGFGAVVSIFSGSKIKKIIKISGAVVIILGFVMINRGLTNFGFGFSKIQLTPTQSVPNTDETKNSEEVQIIEMDVTYSGYKPNIIYIKKDVPVRWIIKDKGITGCTNAIVLYHENGKINKKLNQKENIIEFTPTKLGELKFSCWMSMVWGKFIVVEN